MNRVDEFADDQEDRSVVLWTLVELDKWAPVELDMNGDLLAAFDEVYKKVLETPLGQKLVHHLPRAKAVCTRTKLYLTDAVRWMVIAQNLSEYVVRDYQPAPAPELGRLSDSVIPGAVEYV